MRRTYRSKKETGGALDHRDVILGLDEKASVFEAFYIQNIKQTKRELSCIGSSTQHAPVSNRVRKRKYVKRIVKEVEQPTTSAGESLSRSGFLTPDKSIRVNKAQDLFDQLFNSLSPKQHNSFTNRGYKITENKFKMKNKTYARKKSTKTKRFNHSSSSSSNSNKENSIEDNSDNTNDITDIKKHELLIERENILKKEPMDESINNIFKNMSIFNKISKHGSSNSPILSKIYSNNDHRLTTNLNSSQLSKSPLSSTPFKEKYRGRSIYNFSPIALNKNEDSLPFHPISEDNGNGSVSVMSNQSILHLSEELVPPSPIIHLSANKSSKSDKSSKTASHIEDDVPLSPKAIQTSDGSEINGQSSKGQSSVYVYESELECTEAEPFLGFSYKAVDEISKINTVDSAESFARTTEKISIDTDVLLTEEVCGYENSVIETSRNSIVDISGDSNSSGSEKTENTSYNTCNSDQSSYNEGEQACMVPIVMIERLNDSILKKYINKLHDDNSIPDSDDINSDDYSSLNNSEYDLNNSTASNNSCDIEDGENDINGTINTSNLRDISVEYNQNSSVNTDNGNEPTIEIEDINSSNIVDDSILSNEIDRKQVEDRGISFVTTRRRNDIANNSMVMSFNSSTSSTSSGDCNKTVLSRNKSQKEAMNVKVDDCRNVDKDNSTIIVERSNPNTLEDNSEVPLVNTRSSRSATARDSSIPCCSNEFATSNFQNETKPSIVLQPGKKWERSLSIYRRMTMMTDHFDQSILEDEKLQSKGRKYRQSVIDTMGMQDYRGSLHNDSTLSRRSTFVSKPCRSTIRIVKEPSSSRPSLYTSIISEDLRGFLAEDCDDTVVELSRLSIADSEHEVTVLEQFHDTSDRVPTARDYVLRRCNQADAILFDECYPDAVLKNCHKIGEGIYGEVFLWRAGDGRVRVMKIIPIAGNIKVNGEHQKDFNEIISEIVIAMELSALRAPIDEIQREFDEGKPIDALDLHSIENATDVFNQVLAVRCVYGTYPSRLLDLWELYDECKGSENDNPAILPEDQQYIVLELANAGQDLESFEFNNAEQAHALFLQVAFGLAVGEESFQFEHRDLHWGNILIAPTDQKFATFVIRGRAHRVPRRGVAGTVIDYSLSRVALPLAAGDEHAALYHDLASDEGLFDAVGDYQFEVYRRMRDKLGNDWKNFEPYTNILWLHYTVDKMITALRYKRTNTKIHKHYIAKLKGIKNRILNYGSATEFVLTDNEF